jgi:hypothetical protein
VKKKNVVYVVIRWGDKNLFLIYLDSNAWILGHRSSMLVLKSLEDLNAKNGFYPLKN